MKCLTQVVCVTIDQNKKSMIIKVNGKSIIFSSVDISYCTLFPLSTDYNAFLML